jgi:hypothetical protein
MRSARAGIFVAAASLATVGLAPVAMSTADAAPIDAAVLGSDAGSAAGSCWEIKQKRPVAENGAYWLLTPTMAEPAQFYCDMTTDGGGWVLVGKGRDAWTDAYEGQGNRTDLLSADRAVMGPTTTQHSSATIDGLLGGGRVDQLAEGIRLRRATNTTGTTWQETRMRMARRDRWAWTFGAEHPLTSWSFDGLGSSGGTTQSFGADTTYRRVVSAPQSAQKYRLGFAYGSRVAGSSAATSYLWSFTNGAGGAMPYTEVYLRPRIQSDAGFTAVGDGGTAGTTTPAVVKSRAIDSPWGVTGIAGNTATEGNVEVQAFTQSGQTMYVGGNFASVQRDGAGTDRVSQPFLAAFDVATGEWVSSFRPVLDEQVHALATLPDGTVVAGGEFTSANGAAAAGVVALDPTTGQAVPTWNLKVENRTAKLVVRTLDVQDGWLYVGGALTHMTGGRRAAAVATQNLGRVEVGDGTPSTTWNPKLNGTVNDVDATADGQRVYAVGYFGKANGIAANKAAVLTTAAGAALAQPFTPSWSSAKNNYQRSVTSVGGRVYFGGSEHSLFGYDPATMNRVSGSIMKAHGDVQVIASDGAGLIYAGCHCNNYSYDNAFAWPTLTAGWTQADSIAWFGAWDAATGARVPHFRPALGMRLGSGVWGLTTDTAGTMWAGGDIVSATTKSKAGKWAGGFVRFDASDSLAPATPAGFRVTAQTDTTVTLAWSSVGDAGGGVRYQVLRDDRPIASTTNNATTLTVPTGGSNRFFLRATDAAGNVSASTPVLQVG